MAGIDIGNYLPPEALTMSSSTEPHGSTSNRLGFGRPPRQILNPAPSYRLVPRSEKIVGADAFRP
jgi:hypothetical protein